MSKLLKSDPRWTGAARHTPTINLVVLVLTITTFLLSIIYGIKLNAARGESWNNEGHTTHLSSSTIFFYSAFAPLVSVLYLIIADILHAISRAPPITSLYVSVFFLLVWITQYALWATCDTYISENAAFCAHWPTVRLNNTPSLVWVRFTFGTLCLIGYSILLVFTIIAVHFENRSSHDLTSGNGDMGNKQRNENYEL